MDSISFFLFLSLFFSLIPYLILYSHLFTSPFLTKSLSSLPMLTSPSPSPTRPGPSSLAAGCLRYTMCMYEFGVLYLFTSGQARTISLASSSTGSLSVWSRWHTYNYHHHVWMEIRCVINVTSPCFTGHRRGGRKGRDREREKERERERERKRRQRNESNHGF